jgi:hypothetical protein
MRLVGTVILAPLLSPVLIMVIAMVGTLSVLVADRGRLDDISYARVYPESQVLNGYWTEAQAQEMIRQQVIEPLLAFIPPVLAFAMVVGALLLLQWQARRWVAGWL